MLILKYFWPVKKSETDLLSLPSSSLSEVQLLDPHGPLSSKIHMARYQARSTWPAIKQDPPEAIAMVNATITETFHGKRRSCNNQKEKETLFASNTSAALLRATECKVTNTLQYYSKTFTDISLKAPIIR